MDTKTLDEILRKRAADKLNREITNAFEPVKKLSYYIGSKKVAVEAGKEIDINEAIKRISAQIFQCFIEKRETTEIGDFLSSIESCRDKIDALEASYSEV